MRCNAYGAENPGGHSVPLGGFLPGTPVTTQPVCTAPAVHRFRWICENGHQGPIVNLCEWHEAEFSGRALARFDGGEGQARQFNGHRMPVPWNIRRDVQVCPRCNTLAPECDNPDHAAMMRGRPGRCGCRQVKVRVRLVTVS